MLLIGGMNVKKYIGCAALTMLTMSLLTGCGSGIELSDEENNMVAEYMATALLKYDARYEKKLIYMEEVVEEENKFVPVDVVEETKKDDSKESLSSSEIETSDKENSVPEEKVEEPKKNTISLAEIFDSSSYKVEYIGVKECTTYKEEGNDYFVVEARSGSKLVVAQFKITNTTSKNITVDLADKGIVYSLGGKKALLTIGDLQYYNEEIYANGSKVGVVLFEVDKNADISGTTLSLERAGKGVSSFKVEE